MSSIVIRTDHLSYSYSPGVSTLIDIHLEVNRGDIYGFLGPNGSGKTTTLSLLLGLLKHQQGSIEILGKNLRHHRQAILCQVGACIESPSLYHHLTARENLEIYREIYGAPKYRIPEVLKIAGLDDRAESLVKRFSLGMKQRLSLALALLPRPQLLILDEPTNGLDPAGILELRHLVKALAEQEGITFLISSHILPEIEKVANRLGIISRGRMLFEGTLQALHRLHQKPAWVQIDTSNNLLAWSLLKPFKAELHGDRLVVPYTHAPGVAALNRVLVDNDLDVYNLQHIELSLEDIFIDLITHGHDV